MELVTHDFVTVEGQAVSGRTSTGAWCVRCQMFVPVGLWTLAPCEPEGEDGGGVGS